MFSRKKIIRKIKQQQQDVRRLPWWITALIILAIIVLIVANGCITINVEAPPQPTNAFPTVTPSATIDPNSIEGHIAATVIAQHPDLQPGRIELTPTGFVEFRAPADYPLSTALWDAMTAVTYNTDTDIIPLVYIDEIGFGGDRAYTGPYQRPTTPTPDPLEPEIAAALDRYNYITEYSINLNSPGFIIIGIDERFDIANTRTVITDQIIDITSDRFPDILITIVPVSVDD